MTVHTRPVLKNPSKWRYHLTNRLTLSPPMPPRAPTPPATCLPLKKHPSRAEGLRRQHPLLQRPRPPNPRHPGHHVVEPHESTTASTPGTSFPTAAAEGTHIW